MISAFYRIQLEKMGRRGGGGGDLGGQSATVSRGCTEDSVKLVDALLFVRRLS